MRLSKAEPARLARGLSPPHTCVTGAPRRRGGWPSVGPGSGRWGQCVSQGVCQTRPSSRCRPRCTTCSPPDVHGRILPSVLGAHDAGMHSVLFCSRARRDVRWEQIGGPRGRNGALQWAARGHCVAEGRRWRAARGRTVPHAPLHHVWIAVCSGQEPRRVLVDVRCLLQVPAAVHSRRA